MSTTRLVSDEQKPFNDHLLLPWSRGGRDNGCLKIDSPSWYGFARVWTETKNMVTGAVSQHPEGEATVGFILHACNTYYQREAELQSMRERLSRMEEAATNVLNRWDSPNWEWDKHGHTAGLMADLRNAIAAKP